MEGGVQVALGDGAANRALADPKLVKVSAARVVRPADGQVGIAFRTSLANLTALEVEHVRKRIARLAALRTAGIAPVLEAGISDTVAFLIGTLPGESIEAQ